MSGLSSLFNVRQWFKDFLSGGAGEVSVSTADALSLPAIWNGVSRISGHIAQLPVHVYESVTEDGDKVGATKDRSHPAYKVLNRRPNLYQTPSMFREQVSLHSLLDGNGRAAIVRDGRGVKELIPLAPDCTGTGMVLGEKWHMTRPPADCRLRLFFDPIKDNGSGTIMLEDKDVLHIPGLSADGLGGIALRKIASRNLGMAIGSEKRLAGQMERGYSGGLMLEAPQGMFRDPKDAEEFLEFFDKRHGGKEKSGKTGMVREGMKATILSMNNKDAEMSELRKFARQDQALLLGLEQILGDDSSVSYNSLEQKLLAYLMNCLNRWLKRWEEECEYKLLRRREFVAESHYIRFNTAALLKSDYKTTVESLAAAITATIISPNEARAKLDLNPREGGDTFQNPAITPGVGEPHVEGNKAETDDTKKLADSQAVTALQKVYLAVSNGVVTANEARRMVNELGANLDDLPPQLGDVIRGYAQDESIDSSASTNRKATEVLLGNLVRVECARAKDAAAGSKNFLAWMDRFYSKWESKLADDVEALGGDRDLATQHCDESKRRLLDCADRSTNETLADVVAECVAQWQTRATALANELELANV